MSNTPKTIEEIDPTASVEQLQEWYSDLCDEIWDAATAWPPRPCDDLEKAASALLYIEWLRKHGFDVLRTPSQLRQDGSCCVDAAFCDSVPDWYPNADEIASYAQESTSGTSSLCPTQQ